MNRTTIIHADVMAGLRLLPDESVHCVVTSPPYWGLRDYGVPSSVWGGDPEHLHRWGDVQIRGGPAGGQGATSQRPGRANVKTQRRSDDRLGQFCKCGAWRGSLGLEPTPYLYVAHLVTVFREVRRVLRHDGTCWLNIGDCYATGGGKVGEHPGGGAQGARWKGEITRHRDGLRRQDKTRATRDGSHAGKHTAMAALGPMTQPNRMPIPGLKPKDLVLIPQRLVIALQEDGWWVRRDIIWAKDTCMPESARDRPTTAHEYLWLLTKRPKYYYDALAIAEPSSPDTHARMKRAHSAYQAPGQDPQRGAAGPRANTNGVNRKVRFPSGWDPSDGDHHQSRGRYTPRQNKSFSESISPDLVPLRNKRSVWTINPEPFAEAHFATFPTKLVEPCILAGTSAKGNCPACMAPYVRIVKVKYHTNRERGEWAKRGQDERGMARSAAMYEYGAAVREEQTLGWRPSCKCGHDRTFPATILDPFGGAGTVGLVANRLRRHAILIEIKPEYVEMARRRIAVDAKMFADIEILKLKGGETDGKEAKQETEAEASARAGVLSAA